MVHLEKWIIYFLPWEDLLTNPHYAYYLAEELKQTRSTLARLYVFERHVQQQDG